MSPDWSRSCYFGGHVLCHCAAHSDAGPGVAADDGVGGGGGPVGRGKAVIARSSPGAGYGHPGHVSWVTAKPHDGFPRSYVL